MGIAKMPKGGTKLIARMLRYVAQNYKWSLLLAIVCIFVTSVTTLTSTLFTKTLIDDHILPLTQAASPDFEPWPGRSSGWPWSSPSAQRAPICRAG